MPTASKTVAASVVAKESPTAKKLAEFFHRNGYIRQRKAQENGHVVKKTSEVRLTANSKTELQTIRKLLKEVGFEVGKPYAQSNQFRQPIYGHDAVTRFLKLVGKPKPKAK
jgi:RIO-like serine/threonine protein kinase